MTNYDVGAAFERQAKKVLEDAGYYVVKSGGSRGIVDLCAIKQGEVLLVQAKRNGVLSPGERADLLRVKNAAGPTALALLAYKKGPRTGVDFCHVTCAGRGGDWFPDEVVA